MKLNDKWQCRSIAETGSGAEIHDVIVDADVTSNVASSSYGTGGLIGKISGTSNINNCGVNGSVKNTTTSTNSAYAGGLMVISMQIVLLITRAQFVR